MFTKPNPPGSCARRMVNTSDASGGTFVQPLPTLKESEGLNSSERYAPGRRAFSSSGSGRGLLACSWPPPQALTAKTTSVISSATLRTGLTIAHRWYICFRLFGYIPLRLL